MPQDVQEVFVSTVAHRLQISAKAESESMDAAQVLEFLLSKVRAPKLR